MPRTLHTHTHTHVNQISVSSARNALQFLIVDKHFCFYEFECEGRSGQGRKRMLHLCYLNCTHSNLIITVYVISPAILYFSASFLDFLLLFDVGNSNIIYISSAKCIFQLSFRPALKACMIILKLCV